jgi:hypothetical protein
LYYALRKVKGFEQNKASGIDPQKSWLSFESVRMATSQKRATGPDDIGRVSVIAGLVLLLANSGLALDPHQSLGQFRLVRWDEDQGLPENCTSNIAQTKDGLSFSAPEKVRFRYKLDGFDKDWIDAGERLTTRI